jgi:hypothetical protein
MQTFSKAYRAWLLTILLVSNALNLADRLGMAAVSQAIKVDLRFTVRQSGFRTRQLQTVMPGWRATTR